jgi:DNA-binding SARP family transcriptional activator/WD40 repeat protein/energy-coupling factor transporter ATP-binding protein EcfA2
MEYRVLGPVEVLDAGRPVPLGGYRARLVLAVLLSRPGQALPAEWLVDAVWGERPPRTARRTLQVYLTRLRGLLGEEVVHTTPGGYRLAVAEDDLDTHRFAALADRGHALLPADPAAASDLLHRALDLWRGEPYGDLGGEAALLPSVQALRERYLAALADRVRADLDSGRTAGLLGELAGLVEQHPRDERLLGSLLLAQYRAGRQSQALAEYERYRVGLADELGALPSPRLQRLHAAILRHDPALGAARQAEGVLEAAARNPYKGLRPFGPEDGTDFYGRDALVADLRRRVTESRLVTVVGPSGSGKSSAVLAGLVPALQAAKDPGWRVLVMVPGRLPFEALVDAATAGTTDAVHLRGGDDDVVELAEQLTGRDARRLLLVVDQVEELFEVAEASARDRFVRALAHAVQAPGDGLTVLLTIRADALGVLLQTPPLGPLVAGTIVGVVPLTPAELEAAAVQPARGVGVPLAPDLLAELVADMTGQPGALPQFQYALTEMFEQHDGPMLTLATYRGLGGLRGVVARRAEQSFQALDADQREAARQLFLRLVTIDDDRQAARRRVARTALPSGAGGPSGTQAVLDAFDRARLLTFDRNPATGAATVEIAHEALLREWPRLADWVSTAHDELRLQTSLDLALAEWQESGRSQDYLLGGARLAQVEEWQQSGGVELSEPERAFVAASRRHRDRARQVEADRHERELATQRRAARRLRGLVAVTTVAALLATGLGLLVAQRGTLATAAARDARVRELAASSTLALSSDPELGVLLALEAVQTAASRAETAESVSALHAAVAADRVIARTTGGLSLAFTDPTTLAVGGDTPRLVDVEAGRTAQRLPRPASGTPVVDVAASSRADVALGSGAGEVLLVPAGGRQARALVDPRYGDRAHRAAVVAMAFSPDARLLATMQEGTAGLVVWDTATGRIVNRPLNLVPRGALTFRPDGAAVAVAVDGGVQVRAVPSGALLQSRPTDASVTGLAYTPDGAALVTATSEGALETWEVASGTVLPVGRVPQGVTSLAVDGEASQAVVGTESGEITAWDLTAGGVRGRVLLRLDSAAESIALAPTGGLAAVATTGTTLVLDTGPGSVPELGAWPASIPPLPALDDDAQVAVQPLAVSADGALVATVEPDGRTVRVVTPTPGDGPAPERTPLAAMASQVDSEIPVAIGVAFHPDLPALAIARSSPTGVRHSLETRDLDTGQVLARNETFLAPSSRSIAPYFSGGLAYDPAGTWLAGSQCLDNGSPVLLMDPTSLRLRASPVTSRHCGHHVAVDAAGDRLAVASQQTDQPNVLVLDPTSGRTVTEVDHPEGVADLALAPQGGQLLTVGGDGTGRLWDLGTGEVVHVLRGHRGVVSGAEWSADGTTVLTSGVDGTVRAWDAATGKPGVVLTGLPGETALALTPDGRRLVTVSGTEARVWAWDPDDLVALARSRVDRTLTAAECQQYGVDDCPGG